MRIFLPVLVAWLSLVPPAPAHGQAPPAASPVAAAAPCRTTALATVPQLFTLDARMVASEAPPFVERFYVAVTCDAGRPAGDYQIWWKETLTSPASSARLVAIIDEQTDACGADCFAAAPDFDFFIEVNNWRMAPGCYGVRAIYGDAIDEYWQCTRTVMYTLAPAAPTAASRE
jgi:hypothetical protein